MAPLIDPRLGDVEDDASSTKKRSLLGLAGSLLVEVSLPKLLAAWLVLIVLPGLLLGAAPLIASAWFAALSRKIAAPYPGFWPLLLLILLAIGGWIGWRPLFRVVEQGFWALNSIIVQPAYAACRESLRHIADRLAWRIDDAARARLRAFAAAGAGAIVCAVAIGIVVLAWPASRWIGEPSDLASPHVLALPVLANAVIIVNGYLAVAAIVWGIADALMEQPQDLHTFDQPPAGRRVWRVAHLSDLHVVGERYGFRIESGRAGPRGNERLAAVLAQLGAIHAERPLDLILVTGDVTDAGRSAEWAEFFTILGGHAELAKRMLVLPGNHDLNVVDRANPARLDLPMTPGKRLRQMRALSAIAAIQEVKVRTMDSSEGHLRHTLADTLAPHRAAIKTFADAGSLRLAARLDRLWTDVFPMVLLPDAADGLGVILLNSSAETHFSFTNALGLVSSEQTIRLKRAIERFPRAIWIVALHHHVAEYPKPATTISERIGTALINGTWFVRQLRALRDRVVVMHGHRHIDWIGRCGGVRVVSAPSPVMDAGDEETTAFHIHTLAAERDGKICLLAPETVRIAGRAERAVPIRQDGVAAAGSSSAVPSRSASQRLEGC
jgi:3',5'-cyclic AMP phosphodiesterase CpdA